MKNKEKVEAVYLTDTHKNNDNLEAVREIFFQAASLALKNGCKRVMHAGDFFTSRTGQSLKLLLMLKEILDYYAEIGVTLHAIAGNHDKTDLDDANSYLSVYSDHLALVLYPTGNTLVINSNLSLHFLPYFNEKYLPELERLSKEAENYEKNILITHKSVNGAQNNDGTKVTEGISPKAFKAFDLVMIGHYHDSNWINKRIFYTGAAKQGNFGETIEDKGFHLIYSDATIKFVPSTFKKYITVKLEADDADGINNELERLEGLDANVRFIFSGTQAQRDDFNFNRFQSLGYKVEFEVDELNEAMLRVEGGEITFFDKKAITKGFLDFCKVQGIESRKRNIGLKFLKDA